MDVRCPQCQTLYELDDRQSARGSVTLKCSRCQHVFRFELRSEISQENQRRWMIMSASDGSVLYLTDFADLHRWIMEKKVARDDTISRTGEKWVRLASIPEFAPIFLVVDSIADLTGSPEDSFIATRVQEQTAASEEPTRAEPAASAISASGSAPRSGPPTGERERVKTDVQFPTAGATPTSDDGQRRPQMRTPRPTPGELPPRPGGKPQVDSAERVASAPESSQRTPSQPGSGMGDPAWTIGDTSGDEATEATPLPTPPRSKGPILFVLFILGLGVAAIGIYFVRPDLVDQLLASASSPDEERSVPLAPDQDDAANTTASEGAPSAPAVVATSMASAREAASTREAEIFDDILLAIHVPLGEALDLATAKSIKAAEGGLVDEQLASGRRHLERGQLRQARDEFEAVLAVEPRNADATSGLGFIYLEEAQPTRAAEQFKKAIRYGGGDGSAYIGLGTAERQLNNPQAAYDAYDLYLGRHPKGEKASIARFQMQQLRKQLGM